MQYRDIDKYQGTLPYPVRPPQRVEDMINNVPDWLRNEEAVKARVAEIQAQWDHFENTRKAYNKVETQHAEILRERPAQDVRYQDAVRVLKDLLVELRG